MQISAINTVTRQPNRLSMGNRGTAAIKSRDELAQLHKSRTSLIGTIGKTITGLVEIGMFLHDPAGFINGFLDNDKMAHKGNL